MSLFLVARQSNFRVASGLAPSLSLRIRLWRYLLSGNWPLSELLRSVPSLFRSSSSKHNWPAWNKAASGPQSGRNTKRKGTYFLSGYDGFSLKSANNPERVYQAFARGLNFLTSQCNFLIVYRLGSHICSNTCSRTKKRPKRPPSYVGKIKAPSSRVPQHDRIICRIWIQINTFSWKTWNEEKDKRRRRPCC